MEKMPKHICFLKNDKTKKRYRFQIFSKRENRTYGAAGKSKLLFCKDYESLEEAVSQRDQWLSENDPEKLKKIREKEGISEKA